MSKGFTSQSLGEIAFLDPICAVVSISHRTSLILTDKRLPYAHLFGLETRLDTKERTASANPLRSLWGHGVFWMKQVAY